jgi:hypothetical protein
MENAPNSDLSSFVVGITSPDGNTISWFTDADNAAANLVGIIIEILTNASQQLNDEQKQMSIRSVNHDARRTPDAERCRRTAHNHI